MQKVTLSEAMKAVTSGGPIYARLIKEPTGDVGFYRPRPTDPQKPHVRDEVYVIASGRGRFTCAGESSSFEAGDAFFVPGGTEHRFEGFSDDFAAWVVFFGPAPPQGN